MNRFMNIIGNYLKIERGFNEALLECDLDLDRCVFTDFVLDLFLLYTRYVLCVFLRLWCFFAVKVYL